MQTVGNVRTSLRTTILEAGLTTMDDWTDGNRAFDALHDLRRKRGWSACTFNTCRKNANTYFAYLSRR